MPPMPAIPFPLWLRTMLYIAKHRPDASFISRDMADYYRIFHYDQGVSPEEAIETEIDRYKEQHGSLSIPAKGTS